jgi:teichuronic acid biosynthesis glycosyltransferase TuaH
VSGSVECLVMSGGYSRGMCPDEGKADPAPAAARLQSHDVVLALSGETWDDMASREFVRPPDRLARHLLTSDRVERLLVANPWRNQLRAGARRVRGRRSVPFPESQRAHLVRPMAVLSRPGQDPKNAGRDFTRYSRVVASKIHKYGLIGPHLITYSPVYAAFGDHGVFASVTYVGRDDWASFPPHRHLWPLYREAYRRIRLRSIKVAAVSQPILDRIEPAAASLVVPNGVDPAVWGPAPTQSDVFGNLPRPIALYTGSVDSRLSIVAITDLAREAGTVVLLGPTMDETSALLTQAVKNVVQFPPRGQRDLADAVFQADVCVIPHVVSPLTEAMSPLKVYEYLAAGRPVVSTDLPPVRSVHPSIQLVPEGGFRQGFIQALAAGPLSESDRQDFIHRNDWRSRCEAILNLAVQS